MEPTEKIHLPQSFREGRLSESIGCTIGKRGTKGISLQQGNEYSGQKAFTLVELIIVIAILLILVTITFISYQGSTSQSRDANRLATVKNIKNGIDIFYLRTEKVPSPDNIIGTGNLDGIELNLVGAIGETVTRQINMNEVPLDPKVKEKYMYGVDVLNRYYQVATVLEKDTTYTPGLETLYASDSKYQAKVDGSYEYPLHYIGKLFSLPSLLFLGSGTYTSTTSFIVDTGKNLPYSLGGDSTGTQNVAEVLKIVTGTGNVKLVATDIPSISLGEYKAESGIPEVLQLLASDMGVTDKTKLGLVIFGGKYVGESTSINSLSDSIETTYTGTTSTGLILAGGLGWRDIDAYCPYDDMVIGTQTWAGCNSTLGSGSEPGGTTSMSYDPVFHTIRGKFYTAGANATTACTSGRHVPSDAEWTTLENYMRRQLGNTSDCRTAGGAQCPGLGYYEYATKTPTTNIILALKIPLTGHSPQYRRNKVAMLLTNQPTSLYMRHFYYTDNTITRYTTHPTYAYNVRCIKD